MPTGADPLSSRSIAEAEAAEYLEYRSMLARDLSYGIGPRNANEAVDWGEAQGLERHVAAEWAERFVADLERMRERLSRKSRNAGAQD